MANANTLTRRVFFGCVHVPHHDKGAVKILKEFIKDFKPHDVVNLGDLMSADQISSYPNDSTLDLEDEFEMARQVNKDLGVTHFAMGNHEQRLQRVGLVKKTLRKTFDPVKNLHLVEEGIHWKPYHQKKVFKFGKLTALHGFWFNQYAAAKHAQAYDCCVFVHTHRLQTHQPMHAFVKNTGFNIGCLCRLDLPYMADKPPRGWGQGFAFGYWYKGRLLSLYTARLIGNTVVIEGKVYSRRK